MANDNWMNEEVSCMTDEAFVSEVANMKADLIAKRIVTLTNTELANLLKTKLHASVRYGGDWGTVADYIKALVIFGYIKG
jgi:hypothetical protein